MDPFAGEIIDSKMYGRGSTDMKCGVAAFVAAIANLAQQLEGTGGALLVITAGEEVGCEGAFHMARAGILGRAGAIVVAEPTSNAALIGHKGALWLRLTLKGVTAHGSMPHLGVNAAFKAARAITALEGFQFNVAPHPSLGFPTLKARTAPYFTDASALTPAFGNPPTVILGPGEAAKAHQTDEYCSVRRVHQACDIYGRLSGRWVSTAI
jgi:succinyl-diaminopimelate desuccinylase